MSETTKRVTKTKPPPVKLTQVLGEQSQEKLALQLMMACAMIENLLDCINEMSHQLLNTEQRLQCLELIQAAHAEIFKARLVTPEEYKNIYQYYMGVEGPLQ